MTGLVRAIQGTLRRDVVTDSELSILIGGTAASRWGVVKRAIARGDLIRIRRGLYCLSEELRSSPLDIEALAPLVYGPSYLSFESALARHGWIPERVVEVTSACIKRSAIFDTPLGRFSFTRAGSRPLLAGVETFEAAGLTGMVASPWKALADIVHRDGIEPDDIESLANYLRIDPALIASPPAGSIEELEKVYRNRRVRRYLRLLESARRTPRQSGGLE